MIKYFWLFIILLFCFTLSPISKTSQEFKLKKELLHKSFQKGLSFIKEACSEDDIKSRDQYEAAVSQFLFDPTSRLLMCKTAKHGSTTWAQYFVSIFQKGSQYDGPIYIQKKRKELENTQSSIEEREAVIKQLTFDSDNELLSFFVCRNPVAHMVSVYNHLKKTVDNGFWVKMHGVENEVEKYPSWEEFLRILSWPKSEISTLLQKKMQTMSMPVFYKCSPCLYHYDAVIDMDFFDKHSRMILEAADVGHWVSDSHLNVNGAASVETSRVQELFGDLEPDLIQNLTWRYYPDFKLCGYLDTLEDFENLLKQRS